MNFRSTLLKDSEAALAALLVVHGLPEERAIVVALASRTLSYWIWVHVGALALVANGLWRWWANSSAPRSVVVVPRETSRRL